MKKRYIFIALLAILGAISFFFFDSSLALFFHNLELRHYAFLDYFFLLGAPLVIGVIIVLTCIALYFKKGIKEVVPFVITLIISAAASFVLKFVFLRSRPLGLIEHIEFTNLIDYSFPSSHTFVAFACLPFLDSEFPKIKYIFIALALIMAVSRLYSGFHYLSDIIFGGIFGYITGYVILKAYKAVK